MNDVVIHVDQWSDQLGASQDTLSQTNVALSCSSSTVVSGINNPSQTNSLNNHSSISNVGSHHLLNQDQHSSNRMSGHHKTVLEPHDSLHSLTLTADHSSVTSLDTGSQHSPSTTSITSDKHQQQSSLQHIDDGASTCEYSMGLTTKHTAGDSSILLENSHHLHEHQEQYQLGGKYPSLISRVSSKPTGSRRELLTSDFVGPAHSSRNILAPDSRNLLATGSVVPGGSSRNLLATGSCCSRREQ